MTGEDTVAAASLLRQPESPRDSLDDLDSSFGSEEPPSSSLNAFIWALSFTAGISGLLFGYDTGVISATLVSIGSDLSRPMSTLDKSLITSSTSLFALIASPLAGVLADRLGRRSVVLVADVLFAVGALWQALAGSVAGMIIGRSIVGLAVGGASLVVPLYIAELSPSAFRGMLVTLSILFITGGQVIAYLLGYALVQKAHGWRWMVGLGALPAFVQFALLLMLPETPRWLVKAGKENLARNVLRKVYASKNNVNSERVLRSIQKEVREEEAMSKLVSPALPENDPLPSLIHSQHRMTELLFVGGNRRALVIACMLQALQQLCGFNSIMYFSATIFSLLGFTSPILTSLSVALTNFACTLIALLIIDRVGRRAILLRSIPVMIFGLVLCSISYRFLGFPSQDANILQDIQSAAYSPWATLIVISLVIFVCGYAIGVGNIAWQQSELFPLSVRSLGSGIATATNWGSNFVIGLTFLPMMEYLTPVWTFALYALICLGGWICAWRIYPETKGLGLEDMRGLLKDGWGVKESLERPMSPRVRRQ
ncbi:MAG: hypothetical protein LQ352_002170 [Teloschistes flavicans]|nr:MAG: hypothetical protein LQ352_002170 [Teloschistes flavicans]